MSASVFSENITNRRLYVSFKKHDDVRRLIYASDKIINLADFIYEKLYTFLNARGFENLIETNFCQEYVSIFNINICPDHNYVEVFIEKCVRLLIFKFCKELQSMVLFNCVN